MRKISAMIPDLMEATRDYWRKLDELEVAYQRGEVSIAEVNVKVRELMTDLSRSRRESFAYLFSGIRQLWNEQREAIVGVAGLGVLTYSWLLIH